MEKISHTLDGLREDLTDTKSVLEIVPCCRAAVERLSLWMEPDEAAQLVSEALADWQMTDFAHCKKGQFDQLDTRNP